jgi:uncharacterized protein
MLLAVSDEAVIALAGVFAGGLVQSATGFGYAIVAAPLLAAAYGPFVTAPTVNVLALLANVLTLTTERRPLQVDRGLVVRLSAWNLPGLVIGVALASQASADLLRLVVAGAVLLAVGLLPRARRTGAEPPGGEAGGHAATTAVVSGAFGASTGIGGPPLVLHMLHRRIAPVARRDTLAAVFLVTGVLAIAVMVVGGTFEPAPGLPLLAAGTLAGQLAGRRVFARIERHHDAATIAVLLLGVAGAAIPAIQALS